MTRNLLNVVTLAAILPMSFAHSDEPRPIMRAPNDKMLQQPEKANREVRNPIALDEPAVEPERQSISDLPLTGRRGQETPSTSTHGRYSEHGFLRAGFANCIGRLAKPSTDANHQVGYLGGGTLFGGSCRRADEGTFGMDYSGNWFSRKTWLKWSHGDRHQGGDGRYETEGPRLLPE